MAAWSASDASAKRDGGQRSERIGFAGRPVDAVFGCELSPLREQVSVIDV
jgi:hypothetical protein